MRVAVIPARGGSKRIPRKNTRSFHGKPIIAYSIETALASGLFDGGVWVSTEDPWIAELAETYGAGWITRPPFLAEIGAPDCGTQAVMRHALGVLEERGYEIKHACCIYATAPLMLAEDLMKGYEILRQGNMFVYPKGPSNVDPGQWYWGRTSAFLANIPLNEAARLTIPWQRCCDINTESDWLRAEQMYADLYLNEGIPYG